MKNIWIVAGVVVLLVLVGLYAWLAGGKAPTDQPAPQAGPEATPVPTAEAPPAAEAEAKPPTPLTAAATSPSATPVPMPTDASLPKAMALIKAGEFLEARSMLSALLLSGTLSESEADQARTEATRLAEETLLSPRFFEGDPYTFQYTFAAGETLNAVERKLRLHVPAQLILKINRIPRANSIRAGQAVKMIQGPFHAVVSKGQFTLDLYLQRQGMECLFIKRLRVGLGANGSTPVGSWKVGLGKKMLNATWFPPASSPIKKPLHPGDPNYPLGKAGYWIGLVGTDPNTVSAEGYGLHGTNDPDSIGQASSLGCIRLSDEDIELVFSMLYEEWSTVEVVP